MDMNQNWKNIWASFGHHKCNLIPTQGTKSTVFKYKLPLKVKEIQYIESFGERNEATSYGEYEIEK